jgi:hypothetical protein
VLEKDDLHIGAVDIYDTATATRLGLDPELLGRARFVHESLARGAPPPGVRYFYFAGTGHETVTRVNVLEREGAYPIEEMVVTRTEDAGDGTVPFWSALPMAVQKQVVVNEHTKVFRGLPFKRVFYRLLGGDLGIPLESLGLEEQVQATRLSIPTPIIHAGKEFELLLGAGIADRETRGHHLAPEVARGWHAGRCGRGDEYDLVSRSSRVSPAPLNAACNHRRALRAAFYRRSDRFRLIEICRRFSYGMTGP